MRIFLEVAHNGGWEVAGIELSSDMAAGARARLGVPVAQDLSELPGVFHAITMWEVIEHLPRPLATLTALRERMQPGGLLMLSTPNTGHWQAQQDPEGWEGYRPPSHLLFFNSETLRATLAQAGFRDVVVERTAPAPPLPTLARSWSRPLQQGLADGSARPWRLALYTWRMVRLFGIAWQRITQPGADIFATLVAYAWRP
jgi:SAM-dependent methyltransferase